jgi:hypothetical protein
MGNYSSTTGKVDDADFEEAYLFVLYNEENQKCLRLRIMSTWCPALPVGLYERCRWLLLLKAKGRTYEDACGELTLQLATLGVKGDLECDMSELDTI